ncbi:hypothetical protein [Novipirellula caenicola]|uniref:hypothetical protein n=1 Tax=Novipirellula caenicola TaxID=1536901 RepID=UPI0031E79EF2
MKLVQHPTFAVVWLLDCDALSGKPPETSDVTFLAIMPVISCMKVQRNGAAKTILDFFPGQGLQLDDPHLVSSMSLGGPATSQATGHGLAFRTFTYTFLERDNCEVVCKFLGHLFGVGSIQRRSSWRLPLVWRMQ